MQNSTIIVIVYFIICKLEIVEVETLSGTREYEYIAGYLLPFDSFVCALVK